jgi:hypothetical protein
MIRSVGHMFSEIGEGIEATSERRARRLDSEGALFHNAGSRTLCRKLGRAEIKGVSVISSDLV